MRARYKAKKKPVKRKRKGTKSGAIRRTTDKGQRRKYKRSGRIEAYTFGEALREPWP